MLKYLFCASGEEKGWGGNVWWGWWKYEYNQ